MLKHYLDNSPSKIATIGVILCCWLLSLATPRLLANLYTLYPDTVSQQINKEFTSNVYEICINDINKSINLINDSKNSDLLSLFYLKLYDITPREKFTIRHDILQKSYEALIQSLSINPISPSDWLQLASLNSQLNKPNQTIISALRLSFYTGPVEPELTLDRLKFSYKYYADFDDEMRNLFNYQLIVLWNLYPAELVKFVKTHPDSKSIALNALINSPEALENLSKALNP